MTTNGGASKPCLGYPSRSAAIRGLRSDGLTNQQIAEKTGIPVNNITALVPLTPKPESLPIAREAGYRVGEQNVARIGLNFEVRQMLRPFAAKRGMAVETLITDLVEKIAEDRLVDAVMDDGVQ
ncbi:hypothetical protein [Agrobacterium tumefaciens]|uniref:hypothetical protein n=1 Tax=Agrobacterium tumefaciens complex TaxID=1183400 RepID=UPI001FAA6DC4|nr:hypothetical protein [Agrobacterium tumefaciens]UNZ49480.1 hypothetical protein MLE07_08790 [Agrobacterium tumefaciens]